MRPKKQKAPLKIILVAGARPNFMKVAPLIRAIHRHNEEPGDERRVEYHLVHTGQHYDPSMSAVFFQELGIPDPHINLGAGSGTHAQQTALIMKEFEPVCLQENPDWVVVVGDVNSTMACTLVASKLRIRVAHIEAGLRSYDRTMPEEINRVVTDALADLLLTPSADGNKNLVREGVPKGRIRLVGNIMIDTLVASLEKVKDSLLPSQYGLRSGNYAYVTLHRPGNVDDPRNLEAIMHRLYRLARRLQVVFPVHPRTRKMLDRSDLLTDAGRNMILLEPVSYHDSLWLTQNALFVLTDSGGLQEESTYFKTPCLTLRPNTERPITIQMGTNKLTNIDRLSSDIQLILRGRHRAGRIPRYWDGHTAERILSLLLSEGPSQ
jgi:UDP-N-acetylglucosamine 2-epimerase (non-hydrolysing)